MTKYSLVLAAILMCACGDGTDELAKSAVSGIPPGSTKGSAFSGVYNVTFVTTSCSGQCPTFLGGLITICREGEKDVEAATVTQLDGKLGVVSSGLMVNVVAGGVNADGNFDVGGYGTQQSGAVAVTARVHGTLTAGGKISGTVRARGNGVVKDGANDVSIACTGTYTLTGNKK